jgi:hypothetical protein
VLADELLGLHRPALAAELERFGDLRSGLRCERDLELEGGRGGDVDLEVGTDVTLEGRRGIGLPC